MPVFERELLALNSIKSVCDNTKSTKFYDIHIVIAINKANDELKHAMKSLPVEIIDFGENLGKGIAVNKIAAKYDFDYLISIDSDMICLDSDWILLMFNSYELLNRARKLSVGSLCTQQIGNSCHKVTPNENGSTKIDLNQLVINEQKRHYTNHPDRIITDLGPPNYLITQEYDGGVAGGVLMTDRHTWSLIGGYRATKLYGTDDGFYHAECLRNKLIVGYLERVKFYHPYEFLDEYNRWKFDVAAGDEIFEPYNTNKIYVKFNETRKLEFDGDIL